MNCLLTPVLKIQFVVFSPAQKAIGVLFPYLGSTLCWGNNVTTSYRFYEYGLHVGSAANGKKPCHLANDEQEIMLKSHYALVDPTGRRARWDLAEFGFLNSYVLQAPCKRIALWVR